MRGSFAVDLLKNNTYSLGTQIQLRFSLTQHERDLDLLNAIKEQLGCGKILKDGASKYQFSPSGKKLDDLDKILMPIFKEFPLQTKKRLDAADFELVINIIKAKEHLTPEGLDKIRLIKSRINRGRKF